jgi:hypothetical protein
MRVQNKEKFARSSTATILILVILFSLYHAFSMQINEIFQEEGVKDGVSISAYVFSLLGLVITILTRERMLDFFEKSYGVSLRVNEKIEVLTFGIGGAGKTTFKNFLLDKNKGTIQKTINYSEASIPVEILNKDLRLTVSDYPGQKPRMALDILTKRKLCGEKIHFIVFILNFFDSEKRDGEYKVVVPPNRKSKFDTINELANNQLDLFSSQAIDHLFSDAIGLQRVYLLYNQMDLLPYKNLSKKIDFARTKHRKIRERIMTVLSKHSERVNVQLEEKFVSLKCRNSIEFNECSNSRRKFTSVPLMLRQEIMAEYTKAKEQA